MIIGSIFENWNSLSWFSSSTLSSYEWQYGWALWLIALIPVLFIIKWLIYIRSKQKLPIALMEADLKNDPMSYLRVIPPILLSLSLTLLLIGLARPQKTNEKVDRWTEGIDIMLVVDISGSMQCMDFKPNRLESAKSVARNFISGRFQDRIGVVIFAGDAYSKAPLTTDYQLLNTYIDNIDFNQIQNDGTAIGSAIAVATNRMRESETKSKVLILLSDGDSNAGNIDPITAANLADAYNIKIYSIAVGKKGKVPCSRDVFGRMQYADNQFDETNLREIARIGHGKFYRATSNQALENVFSEIDTLEKAEIKETRFKDTTDFYFVYVLWGIFFLLAWMLTKSTAVKNIMVD